MGFRRSLNSHDFWKIVVQENIGLLKALPEKATVSEAAFRDYVTCGVHRGEALEPSMFDLSRQDLDALWDFINKKACFDMDALLFEDFKKAYSKAHPCHNDSGRSHL